MRCSNCDIPIADPYTLVGELAFCCGGCGAGGPCLCTYESNHNGEEPTKHANGAYGQVDEWGISEVDSGHA